MVSKWTALLLGCIALNTAAAPAAGHAANSFRRLLRHSLCQLRE
jgi:hypothetical protein